MIGDGRCHSCMPMEGGMYRCIYPDEMKHTEHHFNYYRPLTKEEKIKWFPKEANEHKFLDQPNNP